MLTLETWLCLLVVGLIAGISPFALRPLLMKAGIVDTPNHRSSHLRPTIRGGGTAQLLAIAGGGGLGAVTLYQDGGTVVGIILGAGVAVGFVGFFEDVIGLRVSVRLGLQLAIGAILGTMLNVVLVTHWVVIPFAILGFAAYVNFTNFMDGVNGISSLHGVTAGIAYSILGLLQAEPWLMLAGMLVAVSFAAFLPWNLIRPGMFLGDVGSYLLGGTLAAIFIGAISVGVPPIAAAAPLVIYVADSLATLLRRAAKREPLHQAHRQHVYQRLTDTGLSHIAVACLVAAFTSGASAVGVLVASSVLSRPASVAILGAIVGLYISLPSLLRLSTQTSPERMDV